MNPIQLVVTDMDGTLLSSHKKISNKNRSAIKALHTAGIPFVLATGRSMAEIRRSVEESIPVFSYVTLNGAKVYAKDGTVLQEDQMPEESLQAIYEILAKQGVYFEAVFEDDVYTFSHAGRKKVVGKILNNQKGRPATETEIVEDVRYKRTTFFDKAKWASYLVKAPVHKLRVYESSSVPIDSLFQSLGQLDDLELTASNDWSVEVNTKQATKGKGVEAVAAALGVPLEAVLAIGDHLNDVSMLQTVGMPIAVSNAAEEVKQAASHVVATNDQDGFFEAVQRFVFDSNI